jgi:hypothetical protein
MKSRVVTDVLAMAVADQQYSYEFPQNTRGFKIALRATDKVLRYSTVDEMVAVPGENYKTLAAGEELAIENVQLNDQIIYFAVPDVTQVLEIVYWTGIDRAS